MNSLFIQIIRTVVPMLFGFVFAWLTSISIDIPEEVKAETIAAIVTLSSSLYYIGVAYLEKKFPAFGWLLGVARNPVYPTDSAVAVQAVEKAEVKLQKAVEKANTTLEAAPVVKTAPIMRFETPLSTEVAPVRDVDSQAYLNTTNAKD